MDEDLEVASRRGAEAVGGARPRSATRCPASASSPPCSASSSRWATSTGRRRRSATTSARRWSARSSAFCCRTASCQPLAGEPRAARRRRGRTTASASRPACWRSTRATRRRSPSSSRAACCRTTCGRRSTRPSSSASAAARPQRSAGGGGMSAEARHQPIIIIKKSAHGQARPPRRRLEGGLRRLRDGDDGVLPGDVDRQPEPAGQDRCGRYFRDPGVFESTSGGGLMPGASTGHRADLPPLRHPPARAAMENTAAEIREELEAMPDFSDIKDRRPSR